MLNYDAMQQPIYPAYPSQKIVKNLMKKIVLLVLAVLSLASCGGSSTPSDYVVPANLQEKLITPTYPAGSDELDAFNAINAFRRSMGLGYWKQNVLLDLAAQKHMAYSILNDLTFQQDLEVAGNPGFTGITPSQRAINVGYFVLADTLTAKNAPTAVVGELYAAGPGKSVVNSMVNTIYRRSGLLEQSTVDVGLFRYITGQTTPETRWWFNHGKLNTAQNVASDFVLYYPINLQTNVPLSMTPENPSVFSNQPNFNFAKQTSSPISFTSAASTTLTVTSFTVTPAGSSSPVPGTVWTILKDPNLFSSNLSAAPAPTLSSHEAYWVGNTPFLPNTTYNVTFTGSTNLIGDTVTKGATQSWSFTTGNS